ncbi:protein of unknown function [Taphrina deformans PYCC 5710]|uniref:Haem-binding uptake Tiki superfamily ChaN domain-containing protein n=1 Tax=Taphrina deformans (strain PYCC 5710 / ATCC 11124 / CBS 356.35 / IMI 108563 / JCM 9778 / NBRC 8474) TaxID=1097556 RepID=R4XEY1_TAPDE|nr:protein of unknown function [Taphrina deformans PYCC 5710]|eukprot:CCG84341.1 protein of unknown function [Taphrina deformans PYCC 5710]
MAMQRVLARLSPLMVLANREYMPTFEATLACAPDTETSWRDLLRKHNLSKFDARELQDKRVVLFGEQHHQSQVLKAQMTILSSLHQLAQSGHTTKKVVMVMEHFNIEQDDLLHKFGQNQISSEDLIQEYAESREGFRLVHYLPLLLLARELGIRVHGGFPPRQWASLVHKESIEALRTSKDFLVPRDFGEDRWSQVSRISREQVAYLRSMMSGQPPKLPDPKDVPTQGYLSGILPAQTLKDTFFAWSIDKHLSDSSVVVFGVCGLGHSEYNLCASSRIKQCQPQEIYTIATKDLDSAGYVSDGLLQGQFNLADLVVPYTSDQEAD